MISILEYIINNHIVDTNAKVKERINNVAKQVFKGDDITDLAIAFASWLMDSRLKEAGNDVDEKYISDICKYTMRNIDDLIDIDGKAIYKDLNSYDCFYQLINYFEDKDINSDFNKASMNIEKYLIQYSKAIKNIN